MDISEQTVRAHYGEILGVGKEWEVKKVAICHADRRLEAWVEWKKGRGQKCPECGKKSPGYDQMPERTWRHLDACGYVTLLHARVPRSECPKHGVLAQRPPWAEPGSRFTLAFEAYAIEVMLAARSVSAACKLLGMDWEAAQRIRERAVARGLKLRKLAEMKYLGVDEKSFGRGHSYGTVVSDLEGKRVLEVVEKREENSLKEAYRGLGPEVCKSVLAVAMDMWRPYVKVTREEMPKAKVVHDKFHISGILGEAVDRVRRGEHRQLKAEGDDVLTGSKYLWLMDPRNFSEKQEENFATLLSANLRAGRAWALKETFVEFWQCADVESGRDFFAKWWRRTKRSRLKPMQEAADKIKRHIENIVTYFEHRITNATAEGINSFIQAIKANARGFRKFESYRIAILFYLGKLDLSPCETHTKP